MHSVYMCTYVDMHEWRIKNAFIVPALDGDDK